MPEVLSPREENGSEEDSVPMLCREDASLACATSPENAPPSRTIAEIFDAERKKLAIKMLTIRNLKYLLHSIVAFLENVGYWAVILTIVRAMV